MATREVELVTPTILRGAYTLIPIGGSATAIFYADRALTGIEVSIAGGPWFGADAGPQPLPTVGGTLTVNPIEEVEGLAGISNRATVTITSVDNDSMDLYEVRGVNADGAGAGFEAAVTTYSSQVVLEGLLMPLPLHQYLEAWTILERPDDGFAVLYGGQNTDTSTPGWPGSPALDFGNGVVLSGVSQYRRDLAVLVMYSGDGLAQACVGLRAPGTGTTASAIAATAAGGSFVLSVSTPGSNAATGAWAYRRNTDSVWTDYTASGAWAANAIALSRIDASTLAPIWTHVGNGLSAATSIQYDNTLLVEGRGFNRWSSARANISKSATSHNRTVIDELDWATGEYRSVLYAVKGSSFRGLDLTTAQHGAQWFGIGTDIHGGDAPADLPDAIRRRTVAGGPAYEMGHMGDVEGEDSEYWLLFFDDLTPLSWQELGIYSHPTTGRIVGTSPQFGGVQGLPEGAPAGQGRWGAVEPLAIPAGGEAVVLTSAGGAVLSRQVFDDSLSTSKSALLGDRVAHSRGINTGGTSEYSVAIIDGANNLLSTSDAHRTTPGGRTDIVAMAPGPDGAWVLLGFWLSADPAILTPPGVELPVPSADQSYAVASLTSEGVWGTDSIASGMPPDPDVALPPTTPEGTWEPLLVEGGTLVGSLISMDPNAGLPDRVDPVESITISVFDALSGTWHTGGSWSAGGGTMSVENDGTGQCTLQFTPGSQFGGTVRFAAQAEAVTASGVHLYSGIWEHVASWLSEASAPEIVKAEFPDTVEGRPVFGAFVATDEDGTGPHTWRLSPQLEAPYTTTSTDGVAIFDSDDEDVIAGLVIVAAGQGTLTPTIVFQPAPHWHGRAEGSVMVADPVFGSTWERFSVTVEPVMDPLGGISPGDFGEIAEDGYATIEFTVADPDYPDDAMRREWEVSMDGTVWHDDEARSKELLVRLDPYNTHDSDEREITAQIIAAGDYHGPSAFWLRCTKTAGRDEVVRSVARIEGVITSVPDAPRAPQPSRMPTVEQGRAAAQILTTADPDPEDTGWEFQVRRVGGAWSSTSADLGGSIGTIYVENTDTGDKRAEVVFRGTEGFRGRYAFDARVVDSAGLASTATRVNGVVSAQGLYAELVQLKRTTTSASLVPLGPVHLIDPRLTWGIKGPDGATAKVDNATLALIAEHTGIPTDLLTAPWVVELHVWGDGQLQFAGPLTRPSTAATDLTTTLEARGLPEYLTRRELEEADAEYIGVEQTEIIADVIARQQSEIPYGHLLIDTSTVTNTSESRTVTFTKGTSVTDIIDEVQDQLDGPEVRITPDRELLADLILCTDRRGVLLFTEANTTGLKLEESGDSLTTVAHVDGDGVTGAATASIEMLERYGRVTSRLNAKRVDTGSAAMAAANRLIALRGFAGRTVRFTHIAPHDAPTGRGAWDYLAGDTCTLEVETVTLGLIQLDGRIVNKTLRCAPGSNEDFLIDLDVEILPPDGIIRPVRGSHNPEYLEQAYSLHRSLV